MNFSKLCSSDIEIDKLKVEDLPVVLCWYNAETDMKYATGFNGVISIDHLRKKFLEHKVANDLKYLGIFAKKKLIGMVIISNESIKKSVWLRLLVVDNKYQRRGYGTKTIKLLENEFAKRMYKVIYISVSKENKLGIKFWQKNFYEEVNYIGDDIEIYKKKQEKNYILMYKSLI